MENKYSVTRIMYDHQQKCVLVSLVVVFLLLGLATVLGSYYDVVVKHTKILNSVTQEVCTFDDIIAHNYACHNGPQNCQCPLDRCLGDTCFQLGTRTNNSGSCCHNDCCALMNCYSCQETTLSCRLKFKRCRPERPTHPDNSECCKTTTCCDCVRDSVQTCTLTWGTCRDRTVNFHTYINDQRLERSITIRCGYNQVSCAQRVPIDYPVGRNVSCWYTAKTDTLSLSKPSAAKRDSGWIGVGFGVAFLVIFLILFVICLSKYPPECFQKIKECNCNCMGTCWKQTGECLNKSCVGFGKCLNNFFSGCGKCCSNILRACGDCGRKCCSAPPEQVTRVVEKQSVFIQQPVLQGVHGLQDTRTQVIGPPPAFQVTGPPPAFQVTGPPPAFQKEEVPGQPNTGIYERTSHAPPPP